MSKFDAESESETHHFDYGHGVRVDDADVDLYEMSKMMASDAVSRAKKIHADENDVEYRKLVGKKLYQRTDQYRTKRTYVVVAERGDLR